MTATLTDEAALLTTFGLPKECVEGAITPDRADDIGDRLILIPQEISPGIADDDIRGLAMRLAKRVNVVVLVPSGKRAEFWTASGGRFIKNDNIEKEIDALRAKHVGLVVMAGRYDGIDLPDDACRVLIIDGLPESQRLLEKIDSMVLEDSEAVLSRQVQRIEQGMGRGVRSTSDFCVVLLMGPRLISRVHSPKGRRKFSNATSRQLDLSDKVRQQLQGNASDKDAALKGVAEMIQLALSRDARWVQGSRRLMVGVE